MSRLEGPRHRLLLQQWRQTSGVNPVDIEMERTRSELLTAESKRLILESDKASKHMQQDANKRLEQRIRDIQFFRRELEQKLEEIIVEIDVLITLKRRVERALEACTEPLSITILCLEERMKRAPAERVHDEVERELLKERDMIKSVAALLRRTLEQITEQLRLNRSAKYHLEKDLKDKFHALNIDDCCALMTNSTFDNDLKPKDTKITLPSMAASPEEWESFTDVNIAKAEQEKINSLSLRALAESLLEQTATDMQRQLQATASAFHLKVQETKTAKGQMEDHLAKILSEFGSQERNMQALQVAIAEKEIPLKVAQARLSARSQRPATEQCHDPAQARLLSEVQQLSAHISKMREAVAQSEMEQKSLIRCQLTLQENIEIKSNSLYIDEVICTQLRQPIVINNY